MDDDEDDTGRAST